MTEFTYLDQATRTVLHAYLDNPSWNYTVHDLCVKFEAEEIDLAPLVVMNIKRGYLQPLPSHILMHPEDAGTSESIGMRVPLMITQLGKIALEKAELEDDILRRSEKRSTIALVISGLALLISVISIAWQIYTWRSSTESLPAQPVSVVTTTCPGIYY